MILLLIWLIPCVVTIPVATRFTYKLPVHPEKWGQIKGGNKRTAALVGVTYGLEWPILLALFALALLIDWFEAGAPEEA